jgi:hypothetical protein
MGLTMTGKVEWINFKFLMDPDNQASNHSRKFAIFKDGFQEELINWTMAFGTIENLMPLKEPADKSRIFQTLLKGQALSYFEHHLRGEDRGRRLRIP